MAETQAGQSNAQENQHQQAAEGEGAQAEGEPQEKPAPKTYSQDEVDRILAKVRKNARYLGRKEAEAELLRQGVTPRQAERAVAQPEKPAADASPKREDFESYEDFLVARARHEGRQASREERTAAEKAAQEKTTAEHQQTVAREFRKRAEAVMTEIPDFAEAIESAEGVMISEAMGEEIKESPVGPRILYHLVMNPDESARIADLSPKAAIREIAKLEARIEAELAQKKNTKGEGAGEEDAGQEKGGEDNASAEGKGDAERNTDGTFKPKKRSAPEPIEPGSGRSANTNAAPSDKDDVATWLRKRQAEIERNGGRA